MDSADVFKNTQMLAGASVIFLITMGVIQVIFGSVITHSIALTANGIDCLGDSFVSLIVWVGMRFIRRPADHKFNYGYYKIENYSSALAAFVMLFLAIYIAFRSYQQLIDPHEVDAPIFGAMIALIAALGAWILGITQYRLGKGHNMNSVKLEGMNTIKDGSASFLVVVSLVIAAYGYPLADAIVGFFIAAIILSIGFTTIKESSYFLVDACDHECLDKGVVIRQIAEDFKEVKKAKLVRLRKSGPVTQGELEIEVDPNLTVAETEKLRKKIIQRVERTFEGVEQLTVVAVPHLDD